MQKKDKKSKSKSKSNVDSKKNKKNKQKKQKHQNFMKELPSSAFSCATHPTQYLKIYPKQSKNPPPCKSCGFKLQGRYGYLSCAKNAGCYHLCSSCRVCTANHILRNMVALKQLSGDPLYSENRFKCHGCKEEKEVDVKKGVWHCGPCKFSICVECMDRTDALWQEVEIEQ